MKKIITYILCFSLLMTILIPINTVNAASKTLQDYKNAVAELEKKKKENQRLSAAADASIDAKRNAILKANQTIEDNTEKVEEAKVKVSESQEQIKIKTEEMKSVINVLQYTQVNSGELYLNYVFEAESVSELYERQAVVEQTINYMQGQLNDLKNLIEKNEKLQVDLTNQSNNLNKSITTYEKQVEELEAYIDSLATIGLDYDDQIKAQKNLIKIFEEAGCKNSDSVDDCYYNKNVNSATFSRPMVSGTITQAWGNNGHKGMDIGGNKQGTNIYAPANGTVVYVQDGKQYLAKKGYKSCGGNIVYIHFTVNGKAYTGEFAHLYSYNVKAGQKVTKGQVIGTVGGGSSTWYYDRCTTGVHLHYAIAYGFYMGSGVNGYSLWSTFTTNTKATNVQSITGIKNVKGWKWKTL